MKRSAPWAHDLREFSHGVSNVTFRVHLQLRGGAGLDATKRKLYADVDAAFNFKHQIRSRGGALHRLHVEVELVDDPAQAHTTVITDGRDDLARIVARLAFGLDAPGDAPFVLTPAHLDKIARDHAE